MSTVTPMGPNHAYLSRSPQRNGVADTPEAKASAAEKDANKRIEDAEKHVEDALINENEEITHVKNEGQKVEELETERQNQEIQTQRTQGYERLRDLQRQQNADYNRTRRQGETAINQETIQNRDRLAAAAHDGEKQLNETHHLNAEQMHFETKKGSEQVEGLEHQNEQRVKQLHDRSEARYSALNEAKEKEYNRLKTGSEAQSEQAQQHFQQSFERNMAEDTAVINDLENRASGQIRDIRADTAEKLNAYSSRQSDPFYKMRDVAAKVHDVGDSYVLIAHVPEHEQQHISVTVRGNEIALTGYRRNEEKLDIAPGRSKNTASFQSFSESFPLTSPVDAKQLQKEFEGDKLIVTVPKRPEYTEIPVYEKKTPDKVKVERPQFAENLPTGKYQAKNKVSDETQPAAPKETAKDTNLNGKPLS